MSLTPPFGRVTTETLQDELKELRAENESLREQIARLIKERDELKVDLMLWKAECHITNPRGM
jgi:predicted nuclease with TOPRIM domain